jgi:hypothetical protein
MIYMADQIYQPGKGIGDKILTDAGKKNRSGDWYTSQLRNELGSVQKEDINTEDTGGLTIGCLYFFGYSAQSKGLKFYDRQPLSYITDINMSQGYFIGINLHYLNRQYREGVAKSLINRGDTVGVPRNTIHRYFFSGVGGGFLKVPEKDWPSVALLPTEKFVDNRGQNFPNHKAWSKP